jgi:hypothetical protein
LLLCKIVISLSSFAEITMADISFLGRLLFTRIRALVTPLKGAHLGIFAKMIKDGMSGLKIAQLRFRSRLGTIMISTFTEEARLWNSTHWQRTANVSNISAFSNEEIQKSRTKKNQGKICLRFQWEKAKRTSENGNSMHYIHKLRLGKFYESDSQRNHTPLKQPQPAAILRNQKT